MSAYICDAETFELLGDAAREIRRWEYQSCETGDLYSGNLGMFTRYFRDEIISRLCNMAEQGAKR